MEEFVTLYYGNLPYLGGRQRNLPDTLVIPTEMQTGLCGVRSSLMNWRENTWAGPLPTGRSGDSSYWSACSTMWPPWRRKSMEGSPEDYRKRQPRRWPLTPLCVDPHRCHWWSHSASGWTSLPRRVDIGSQCALPSTAGWLYEGATTRIKQTYV